MNNVTPKMVQAGTDALQRRLGNLRENEAYTEAVLELFDVMSAAKPTPEDTWKSWYEGKTFTTDWASRAFTTWMKHLSHLRPYPIKILEIGAWEGRSTLFFLNYFPNCHVTCVDLFTLGNGPLFDANVMSKHSDRVTKIAARSARALDKLATTKHEQFDLIYLDGSHERDDVIVDSVLCWRLLRYDCFMIWDDYGLLDAMHEHFDEYGDPKPAINTFLEWHRDEVRTIDIGYQMMVKKIKERPASCLDDPEAQITNDWFLPPRRGLNEI